MTDFAAIDFETANECPSSVCSVGIVTVRGGEIADRFYSLRIIYLWLDDFGLFLLLGYLWLNHLCFVLGPECDAYTYYK